MVRRPLVHLAPLFLILFAGCNGPGSKSAAQPLSQAGRSPDKPSWEQGVAVAPDKILNQEGALAFTLPERGVVLALTRWGSTTVAVLSVATGAITTLAAAETGQLVASLAGERLAYLVRAGVYPANNHVEIVNLRRRTRQLVRPASDFAILGFALSPSGSQLAYAEINLRWSNSQRAFWRIGLADLEKPGTQVLVASRNEERSDEGIPIPFAWSGRLREIYLQRLLPFRGMVSQGIWAMKPDGSGSRLILSEPSYTGLPRLSPDGGSLAYLVARVDALPRDYISEPGAPPGNVLAVMNPTTAEETIWAQKSGSAFGAFAWSPTGRKIIVAQREWLEGRFHDAAFVGVGAENSRPLRKIALQRPRRVAEIQMCRAGPFFWVEQDKSGASLRGDKAGPEPVTFLALPEGKIRLIGCLWE